MKNPANPAPTLPFGVPVAATTAVPAIALERPHGCTADHAYPGACPFAGSAPECGGCRWFDEDWRVFEAACVKPAKAAGLIPEKLRGGKKAKKKPSVRALLASD